MPIRISYDSKVSSGRLTRDPAQERAVIALDALCDALDGYAPARKSAALGWLFGAKESGAPRGLYIWGGVGRGKSMLMDMFFEAADVAKKRRVHFHAFMAEIHAAIFRHRQAVKRGDAKGDDPIEPVAQAVARSASLLCFDEFAITDIADAMILGRLFKILFSQGVVVVATSNVQPAELYRDGLNRQLFLPSIALLEDKMDVLHLASANDYRMARLAGASVFHVPNDAAAREALDRTFEALTGHRTGKPTELIVLGRSVPVPCARGRVARFTFADLCGKPLGAGDFLAIAQRFASVILDDIPVLRASQRNETKRFIILVDALYEAKCKVFASASAVPEALFETVEGIEAFESQRTVSRLNEMQSDDYLALPHGAPVRAGTEGIVET